MYKCVCMSTVFFSHVCMKRELLGFPFRRCTGGACTDVLCVFYPFFGRVLGLCTVGPAEAAAATPSSTTMAEPACAAANLGVPYAPARALKSLVEVQAACLVGC